MPGRVRATLFATLLSTGPAYAQVAPAEPRLFPPVGQSTAGTPATPAVGPSATVPAAPPDAGQPAEGPRVGPHPDPTVKLPRPERLARIDPSTVTVRLQNESWQLWAGAVVFRDFGRDGQAAQDALAAVRGLRPTEWGVIGSPRPVVEYGLTNGEPPKWVPVPRHSLPVDVATVRAEPVRGAWVVRDDKNILLNFGPARGDAEQAAAVAKRHGFNRLGLIGGQARSMAYYYVTPAVEDARPGGASADPFVALVKASQEANLSRTAIDVPGVGLIGERMVLDPRLLEVRKDRADWVLAHGPDVLARFGYSELSARDALRVVRDARLTEFCRVGTGLTFFLVNGKPPARVSYEAQSHAFDPARLTVRETSPGAWAVCEGTGRPLFPAASRAEAEAAAKVVQAYKFDQACQVGSSPKASLRFLAKTGR